MKNAIRTANEPKRDRAPEHARGSRRAPARAGLPREGYVTLEAATLAGAASGVAVGAIGGPPGAIVGGIIGTAVGMMAGSTLDVAQRRADAHDRELDDMIGVTEGDLGAREKAMAGLRSAAVEGAALRVIDDALTSAAERLRAEHARLEGVYEALLDAYRDGDWDDVRAAWTPFESAMRAHMDAEEKFVFPTFVATSPREAGELLAEHDELRRMLDTLAVNIDLHALPVGDAEELIRRLRAHGEREERVFYPWIEATFGDAPLHSLPAAR